MINKKKTTVGKSRPSTTNGKEKTLAPCSVRNMKLSHTTSTSPIKDVLTEPLTSEISSKGASSSRKQTLTDSTEKHNNDNNKPSRRSNTSSTVSTPTSSQCTLIDASAIINRAREYLGNLIHSLETGERDVDLFVVLLQNICNGDEALIGNQYEQSAAKFAVNDMIEETVQMLIKKRDELCVDDDETKQEYVKLDRIIAELVIRQESP